MTPRRVCARTYKGNARTSTPCGISASTEGAPTREAFAVTFKDTGTDPRPMDIRVRQLIKFALRRCGLKNEGMRPVDPAPSLPLTRDEAELVVQAFGGTPTPGKVLTQLNRVTRCSVCEDRHGNACENRTSAAAIVRSAK